MYNFILNGKQVSADEDISLLEFLRERQEIVSLKNGCAEGVCGACMVLVDNKAARACILKTSKLEGKNIVSIEGLSDRDKDVFAYAFGSVGAVQCGFCIPGMVVSAKGLFINNLNPTLAEVKEALKFNVCRCTGYKKIEEAILLAARIFRENLDIPDTKFTGAVGENIIRLDSREKTLGEAKYVDDLRFPDMVFGSALRTKYPRAKVLSINTEKAKAHPDCIGVFTAEDVPGQRNIGHLAKDWDAMIAVGEITRYVGDSVALVVSKTKKSLSEILSLIEVEYEELTPLTNPQDALKEDAPKIHESGNMLKKEILKRGDSETAIKNSKFSVTYKYSTPFTEHAFLEPECAIGMPDADGVLIYTGGQSVYDEKRECAMLLGLPLEKVRVISAFVGGGFGGKEDMSVQHHAALLAYLTKKTVKVLLSRKESIMIHPKRHAMEMEFTTACDENGILTGMKALIISDTGAYASLGGPVLQRACTHAAGPYNYQNIDITGIAVYTNNPPAGAFRGFGVTQSCFATEANLNKLAELVGISPWEIRYRNAIRPGQILPNGQFADEGTALVETLEAVKDVYENNKYVGIACALKNAGLGVGVPDTGRTTISIEDGKAHIRCSAACIGQGMATILLQMFCETTKIDPSLVVIENPDTSRMLDSGTTTASRQTVFSGQSCVLAARKLKEDLEGKELSELNGKEYYGEFKPFTDPMGSDKPNPISHVAYGYATQVVVLNEEGKVVKVVAAHDIGKAINPNAAEGQVEGGVVMGLGYALTEDYPLVNSVPQARFGTLGLFKAPAVPEIETILVEKNKEDLAYGAKGIGEITTIPTAPAVQNAYYVLDGEFRTKLPLENTYYKKKK